MFVHTVLQTFLPFKTWNIENLGGSFDPNLEKIFEFEFLLTFQKIALVEEVIQTWLEFACFRIIEIHSGNPEARFIKMKSWGFNWSPTVVAGHNMLSFSILWSAELFPTHSAFYLLQIWLGILVAINAESYQRLFPSFCMPASELAVLLDWNLSRVPFHRVPFQEQVVNWDLLLCTGFTLAHADSSLFLTFKQRPRNDRKIKQSSEYCFDWFHFTWEKNQLLWLKISSQKLFSNKTFSSLTLELDQNNMSNSTFSSSKPVAASSNCSRIENTLCSSLWWPVWPAQVVQASCQ